MILDTIDKDCNLCQVPGLTLATKSNCVRLSKDIFEKKKQKKQNQNKQRKKMGAQATSLQEKMEVHVKG